MGTPNSTIRSSSKDNVPIMNFENYNYLASVHNNDSNTLFDQNVNNMVKISQQEPVNPINFTNNIYSNTVGNFQNIATAPNFFAKP
jgi:hypothetical protein